MILYILRGAFILLAASVAMLYVLSYQQELAARDRYVDFGTVVVMLGVTIGVAGVIVAIDAFTRRKKLAAVSGVFLGLVAGLLAAYALSHVVDLVGLLFAPAEGAPGREGFLNLLQGVKVIIGLITCYLGISLVLQTKDDFRFVIPYVEFAKQIRGNRPTVLDTSVIIDGRVLDIIETRLVQGVLVVPKFVLNELQTVADSADKLRRARGRRGLDTLQKLQDNHIVEVHIDEADAEGGTVDQKLINFAQTTQARVMTNDYNLNKIATLRGVDVINLNDLAKALRPVVLPGEHMNVRLVKPGEGPTQGVGYLDDGTMVVVENGRHRIGEEIEITVTSTLQTSAGRMIFGRIDHTSPQSQGTSRESAPQASSPASDADATAPPQETATAPPDDAPASGGGQSNSPRPAARRASTGRNPRRSR